MKHRFAGARPLVLRTCLLACLLAPLATTAGAAAQAADLLTQARAAAEQRDWAAALPRYEALAAQQPANADLLIEAARVQGFADRNAAAAALYRQALAAALQRRADILPSLAWQTLWSGQPEAALALFSELSASSRSAGERADAWDGLGQSHQALSEDAAAAAALARAAELQPERRGLRERLARAWYWAGFEDRALPLLADSHDPELQHLRDYRLQREAQPRLWAGLAHAIDSDRLETWAWSSGAAWRLPQAASAELQLTQWSLEDHNGSEHGPELLARWRGRFGDPQAASGTVWPQASLRLRRFADWTPLSAQLRATWVPRDHWRVDVDAGREIVDNPLAVANRVSLDQIALGLDWRPHPRWLGTLAVAGLRFDDGNRRTRWRLRGEYTVQRVPHWTVGAEAMGFRSSDPTGASVPARGYWNPRQYTEQRVFSALQWAAHPWDLTLRLGLGRSRERDGWGTVSHGDPHQWEIVLGWDLGRSTRLVAQAGGSGAGMGLGANGSLGGSGYWRRSSSLSLSHWF